MKFIRIFDNKRKRKHDFDFREIAEHNITIGEYFRDCEALESLRQRCAALPEINQCLLERTTALQVCK